MDTRKELLVEFINRNNLAESEMNSIETDASFRKYYRINNKNILVMDVPSEKGESAEDFQKIDKILLRMGISAPAIYDIDKKNGFILLEDFGDQIFSKILDSANEYELYNSAISVLAHICKESTNTNIDNNNIPDYSIDILLDEAKLFYEWYLEKHLSIYLSIEEKSKYQEIIREIFNNIDLTSSVLVLRDYHVDNLIFLKNQKKIKQVGVIDFQDALIGSNAYDIISLLEDVRRPIDLMLKERLINNYVSITGCDQSKLLQEMNFFSIQRNMKIIGIFSRLKYRDGKDQYMKYLNNAWDFIDSHLEDRKFSELKKWILKYRKRL